MPYIPVEKRIPIDQLIEKMIELNVVPNGEINYLLFAYAKRAITPSYNNYKSFIGELHCAITEIERRLLAEYENQKIELNGDIDGCTKEVC